MFLRFHRQKLYLENTLEVAITHQERILNESLDGNLDGIEKTGSRTHDKTRRLEMDEDVYSIAFIRLMSNDVSEQKKYLSQVYVAALC